MESNLIRAVVHYGLHFLAPLLLALLFKRGHRAKAYWVMVCTMLVDLDHLFANPVFDPHRMSVGFHPLHSYVAIGVYALMCLIPYEKLRWPCWIRAIGIGLIIHMLTDWQDYALWVH